MNEWRSTPFVIFVVLFVPSVFLALDFPGGLEVFEPIRVPHGGTTAALLFLPILLAVTTCWVAAYIVYAVHTLKQVRGLRRTLPGHRLTWSAVRPLLLRR